MTQRCFRVWASYLRQSVKCADNRTPPAIWTCGLKGFGTGRKSSEGDNDDGGGADAPGPPGPTLSRFSGGASLFRTRRPLSPLERVSQLLPQDSLSKEVWELRDAMSRDKARTEEQTQKGPVTGEGQPDSQRPEDGGGDAQVQDGGEEPGSRTAGTEWVMCFGEALMAEYRRSQTLEFRKMFQLREGMKLQSNWGLVSHTAIAGQPAGTVLRTSLGLPMLIRRPSLEEFTLFMRRGPAIAYPKDTTVMLMMMDVNEGDCVLESGSGSGALSLFLSRAVGSKGSVLSFEVREDHHTRSVFNYQRWRSTWKRRRGEEWPDNVHFHHSDLISAAPLLAGKGFNSVALDMVNPHLVLPTVVPHLHNGAVCAVYLANVTQIIDLMEGLRCTTLPLVCERIIEVQHRDWLLAPSLRKDGTFNKMMPMNEETTNSEKEDSNGEENEELTTPKQPPFGRVPYIARPHPEQVAHTAFLVKLRKILK